jgi:hypothetical protein
MYLLDLSDNYEFDWSVHVMQKAGEDANGRPTGQSLSPMSEVRILIWKPASGGPGAPTSPPP